MLTDALGILRQTTTVEKPSDAVVVKYGDREALRDAALPVSCSDRKGD